MAKFDDFIDAVTAGIKDLAASTVKSMRDDALKDGKAFLEKTKEDLKRWTKLLASGGLSKEDFEWLVEGKKDLAEMELLKQRGLLQVKIDRFVNGVIDLVIEKAFDTFL